MWIRPRLVGYQTSPSGVSTPAVCMPPNICTASASLDVLKKLKERCCSFAGGESVEFMPVQYGNAVRAAHPEPSVPIFLDVIDTVACQPVGDAVVGQQAVAEPKEAIVPRSDPQPPILVLVQRPDLVLSKRLDSSIADEHCLCADGSARAPCRSTDRRHGPAASIARSDTRGRPSSGNL